MEWMNRKTGPRALLLWSAAGILLLTGTSLVYLYWQGFVEQGEVTFATVSWLAAQGYPLYTELAAAERYSLQHGPVVYLTIAAVMKMFGPGYVTAKLANVAALILSVAVSWIWFAKLADKRVAFVLLGLEAWLLLHWPSSYMCRPDSIMLLCMVVSLYLATVGQNRLPAAVLTGIAFGLMINLKIHGIVYFLPIMLLVYERAGGRRLAVCAVTAALVALLPFVLPNVSFFNYFDWVFQSLRHGILFKKIVAKGLMVAELALLITVAGTMLKVEIAGFYRRYKRLFVATAISLTIIAIIGSKAGSGTNHLMPFIPLFCYMFLLLIAYARERGVLRPAAERGKSLPRPARIAVAVVFVVITVSGINGERRVINHILAPNERQQVLWEEDLIERVYAGKTIEVGYGEERSYTKYRDIIPMPVFRGNPYLVDAVALNDIKGAGHDTNMATIRTLEEGRIQVWLIPRGDAPFAIGSFDDKFRQAFYSNYVLTSNTRYFDIWTYVKGNKSGD